MNPDNSEVDLPQVVHPFRIFPVIFHLEFPFSSKKEREREKKRGKKSAEKSFLFSPRNSLNLVLSCLVTIRSLHFFIPFFFISNFHFHFFILFYSFFSPIRQYPLLPRFLPALFSSPSIPHTLLSSTPPPLPFITCCSPDRHLQIFFFLSSFSPLVHIPPPYSLPFSTT